MVSIIAIILVERAAVAIWASNERFYEYIATIRELCANKK